MGFDFISVYIFVDFRGSRNRTMARGCADGSCGSPARPSRTPPGGPKSAINVKNLTIFKYYKYYRKSKEQLSPVLQFPISE